MTSPETAYRVNEQIKIREVRLIDQHSEQIGVVTIEDARRRALDAQLDLVEVAPNSKPPVCRIMDYGKFKYEIRKKHAGAKHHETQLHEVRVRPKISDHDLSYKIDKAREFIIKGDKVQVNCQFRGRELAHPELGERVCVKVVKSVEDVAKVERPLKLEGKRMTVLLTKR
ncbi:MAG: translation initiation factor IF-3 [Planctomycetota bacterium]